MENLRFNELIFVKQKIQLNCWKNNQFVGVLVVDNVHVRLES